MMDSALNGIRRFIPKDSFFGSVAVMAGGTAFGQALVVIASPVLTRIYTPEDFGVLSVYTSITSILVVLVSLRYEVAIALPGDDKTAVNLLLLSLAIVFSTSLIFGSALILSGGHILAWTNALELKNYLWLFPLSLICAGSYQVLNYWAVRKRDYASIARASMAQCSGMVSIQVIMGFISQGPVGLLMGQVAGQLSAGGYLGTLVCRQDRDIIKGWSVAGIRRAAYRYRRFPLYSGLSVLCNSSGLYLPAILLAAIYGPQVSGWFALGQRVIGIPLSLLGKAVEQVYLGEASRLAQENPGALHGLFLKTALKLFLIGIIPIASLGIMGPFLFSLMFGDNWITAGKYIQILFLMYLVKFVVSPLDQTLSIIERQDLQLYWDAGRLVLVVGCLITAKYLGWSDVLAIYAYGGGMLLTYLIMFGLLNCVLKKQAGMV